MAVTRKSKLKIGPFILGHTHLIAKEGDTFELWNNLQTYFDRKKVLKALDLPQGVLPIGVNGKLIFGEGNFGKVRLAKRGDEFVAVKKTKWQENISELEGQMAYREYFYCTVLKDKKISNVMAVDAIMDAENPDKNKHTLYQFMPLATLGDGINLKRLLKNLDAQSKKIVLSYTAATLLKTLGELHANEMYHRDIKANNILFNHDGKLFLSDFGSGHISAKNSVTKKDFQVSDRSDFRYLPPEMVQYIVSGTENKELNYSQLLDNWRLGITLLQLCDCVKEGEGILANFNSFSEEAKNDPYTHFQKLFDELKLVAQEKVPAELQPIIFGLLAINPKERLDANRALQKLALATPLYQQKDVEPIFRVLTRYHVPQAILSGLKKSLKNKFYDEPMAELYKIFVEPLTDEQRKDFYSMGKTISAKYKQQVLELIQVVGNPDLEFKDLNAYLQSVLGDKSKNITKEQFGALSALGRLKSLQKAKKFDAIANNFKPVHIGVMIDQLNEIVQFIKADYLMIPNRLNDLLQVAEKIKDLNYFATSYSYFYRPDKTFKETLELLKTFNENFNNLTEQVFEYLKETLTLTFIKLTHVLDAGERESHLTHLDMILDLWDTLSQLFENSDISKKDLGKLKELIAKAKIEKSNFIQTKHDQIHEMHDGLILSPTKLPSKDEIPAAAIQHPKSPYRQIPSAERVEEKSTKSEIINVKDTQLFYVKSETSLHYQRPKNYLDNYLRDKDQTMTDKVRHDGYTDEEKILINKMVADFLTQNKDSAFVKGNSKLAHLAAEVLHHQNPHINIYVNGVHYHDAMVTQFSKLLHPEERKVPEPSSTVVPETKPTE